MHLPVVATHVLEYVSIQEMTQEDLHKAIRNINVFRIYPYKGLQLLVVATHVLEYVSIQEMTQEDLHKAIGNINVFRIYPYEGLQLLQDWTAQDSQH